MNPELIKIKAALTALEYKLKEGLTVTEDDLYCLLAARCMMSEQDEEIRRRGAEVRQHYIEGLIRDRKVRELEEFLNQS